MSADKNFRQQQPHIFSGSVDGSEGKTQQLTGEPQFNTEKHHESLTSPYGEQTRTDPYHALPVQGNNQALPLYGTNQQPIYQDQLGTPTSLYPGQENFLGREMNAVNGKEVLTTGGVVQAAYVPPGHGVEEKKEHVHLSPENQHVQLPPSTEHVHIKAAEIASGNVDQVIRIKPDGKIQVTTEKVEEPHHTEHLKKEHVDTHHHGTEKKEQVIEKEHTKTKKVTKKKKHASGEKVKRAVPTETTTVVKVSEHEPGTGGYDKEGKLSKHDDTHHHGKKDHVDTHHHGTDETHHHSKKDHVDTHHHGTDETKVVVNKEHHGVPILLPKDKEEETKVHVNKAEGTPDHVHVATEEHGKTGKHLKAGRSGKKKRSSKKRHSGDKTETKTETKTEVKVSEHEPGTAGYDKEGKLSKHDDTHHHGKKDHVDTHHHGTDETKVVVNKEHHGAPILLGKEEETKVHVKEGKLGHDKTESKHHGSDETHIKVDKEKHHHGSDESKIKVDKDKHHSGGNVTHIKVDNEKHHHGSDESKIKVDKDKHHSDGNETHINVHDRRPSDDTHVRAGTITKPQEHVVETQKTNQGLVQQLRTTLSESDTPNMDVLGELLLRAEALLDNSARQKDIDPEARKTLQDISTLLGTAKQMERNKGISERLQKISDECQKSLSNMKESDAPSTVKNASKEAVEFVKIWRPVFQLLIRSRDFRQLFVDLLRIAKRVVSRNDIIMDDLSQRFIEGESAQGIKESAKVHRDQNVDLSMTDEEWEYLQDEIQSVMIILARNPQYHDAINRLFTLLEMFNANMKETLPGSGKIEPHALKAKKETEELVATFTGKETLKGFKISLRRLGHAFNNDPELQLYFTDVKAFTLSSKSEEEVRSEAFKQRSRDLVNRGRYLVNRSKDRREVDNFIAIGDQLMENIKNDEYVKELRSRAGIVRSDLTFTDTEGRTKIDVDMLVKLQHVLMPVLAETFKKIQIPRIENSDKRMDWWVDNIVLCGYDIFPDNIKFHIERDSELSIRDIESKGSHTRLVMHLDKIRTEIKNIEFYFKRKTFPSISDSGLVTVRIPENGAHLGIFFTIEDRPGEKHSRLTEGYADFNIHKMDIEFDKSTLKHDVLLPIGTSVMKPIIRSKIEKAVETNLTNILQQLGERMTTALGEINRPGFGNMGSVKETIKSSEPAQVLANRKSVLE